MKTESEVLAQNANKLREIVAAAAERSGRAVSSVRVIPASKTRSAETINALLPLGFSEIGENRVQELTEKYAAVDPAVRWHFIGQLQTNKVKYLIGKVTCIQSLDRAELACEIERQAQKTDSTIECMIEINIARSALHGGVLPAEADGLAEFVTKRCPHIVLTGIMGVLPHDGTARAAALEMKKCSETLAKRYPGMVECSMGMSEDLATAIECGATIVRPGRILFGERPRI